MKRPRGTFPLRLPHPVKAEVERRAADGISINQFVAPAVAEKLAAMGAAALNQTVIVTRNGRDRTVMVSAEEYQRLKPRDRQVYAAGELVEEIV